MYRRVLPPGATPANTASPDPGAGAGGVDEGSVDGDGEEEEFAAGTCNGCAG